MYHLIPAGTHLYRVTDIGRTWQDVVSGGGSYFVAGGRYNRVQQRTVYAATDPLVSIAENSVHVAIDRWQPRIGGGSLGAQTAFPAPVPPFISEHWLWDFTIDVDMQLVRVETQPVRAAFNHRLYELFNDWARPWFCLSNNAAALPAFPARPNAQAFASGVWHQVRVKYT